MQNDGLVMLLSTVTTQTQSIAGWGCIALTDAAFFVEQVGSVVPTVASTQTFFLGDNGVFYLRAPSTNVYKIAGWGNGKNTISIDYWIDLYTYSSGTGILTLTESWYGSGYYFNIEPGYDVAYMSRVNPDYGIIYNHAYPNEAPDICKYSTDIPDPNSGSFYHRGNYSHVFIITMNSIDTSTETTSS